MGQKEILVVFMRSWFRYLIDSSFFSEVNVFLQQINSHPCRSKSCSPGYSSMTGRLNVNFSCLSWRFFITKQCACLFKYLLFHSDSFCQNHWLSVYVKKFSQHESFPCAVCNTWVTLRVLHRPQCCLQSQFAPYRNPENEALDIPLQSTPAYADQRLVINSLLFPIFLIEDFVE